MTKGWLQRLQNYLRHLSHWRQISTAPYNQELELRITENGEAVTLEFPCLRTNEEAWINVDLGSEIKVQPVEWRIWQGGKSPEPHHSKIRLAARRALTHLHLRRAKRRDTGDEALPTTLQLSRVAMSRLRQRAEAIGVNEAQLASDLLEVIAQDDLYDAVLDRAKGAA